LSSPHREALNQRNKKIERKRSKKNPPGKKIPPRKNISPAIFFETHSKNVSRVFELPCRETPKNAHKKKKTQKKRRYVRTFFCELAQMYVVFSVFFPVAPRDTGTLSLHGTPF
jgi:hypothetical protein